MPVILAAGGTLGTESCPPANNAIDPGERVTVNLKVMDIIIHLHHQPGWDPLAYWWRNCATDPQSSVYPSRRYGWTRLLVYGGWKLRQTLLPQASSFRMVPLTLGLCPILSN